MSRMSPGEWQALSPHLDHALTLDHEARAAWLAFLKEQNPELADRLQALLKTHRELNAEGFLNTSPIELAEPALAGRCVGPYKLLSPIGQGGMGTVWLAERGDGRFERQAAVKFVNLSVAGRVAEERFKRESSILGRLMHPHIAALLDAGVSDQGRPYIVLEHVEGEPIDEYCDKHRLDIEGRIRLFLDVLSAVAHAHANLIVHRDLKPSNVLVSKNGQAKLLDFGIAKLLSDEEAEATVLTAEAGSALTPRFAAPEQITGGAVTTATDIYALGVLLYLLLTGRHPAGTQTTSAAELVKAIVETEPPRASSVIASSDDIALADKRSATLEKLQRQMRGDVDTILSKALKKNSQERYASVTAFADDLTRYLDHEPISARPDTLSYRAKKFLQRNRAVVVLVSIALLLVIGSLSTGLLLANRERKIAERRFSQVRQLADKFIALDTNIRGLPGSTYIRVQIVSDSLQYLSALGNEANINNDLALEIAFAYVRVAHVQGDPTSPNLGQFSDAKESLNKAEGFVDRVLSSEPKNARALFIAATIAHDRMVLGDTLGDRDEELAQAKKAVSLIERFVALGNVSPNDVYSVVYFYLNIASTSADLRHFDDAIRYCRRAAEIAGPVPKAHHEDGNLDMVLALALWQSGDLEGALKTTNRAVEFDEEEAADGEAMLLINLADTLNYRGMIEGRSDAEPNLGRSREALADFRKAFDIADDLAAKDAVDYLPRHSVAMSGLEIGNLLRHTDPRRAQVIYDRALTRIREANRSASTQRDEAELLAASSYPVRWLGHNAEAQRQIDKALELMRGAKRYPADKVEPLGDLYDVMRAEADNYSENGQTEKAIEAYLRLLSKLMAWKLDPPNDLRDATCISRTWTALADLLRRAGRAEEAGRFEAERTELWTHWKSRLPNAEFLLRQSLLQITPRARHRPAKPQQSLDPR